MSKERRVRLHRIGGRQVVNIPAEFEFPRDRATIRKIGDTLVLEQAHTKK